MMGYHEDERGHIMDLLENIDAVTKIWTVKGAVRGNHYHRETTQWTIVTKGCLLISEQTGGGSSLRHLRPGEIVEHRPGVGHAWRAVEDTECLVFTRGPRSGENYEQDTYRLDEPLLEGPGA